MTLEEAIEYYKRLEESQRRVQEKYPSSSGKEVAEHFAKLVEWLKELHAYRKARAVTHWMELPADPEGK